MEVFAIDDAKGRRFAALTSAPDSELLHQMYKTHTPTLARLIAEHFPGDHQLSCAEFGGGPGTLVKDLKEQLKRPVRFTNIDCSSELLALDTYSDEKVCCRLQEYDAKGRFDAGVMRYVLQYNSLENQQRIIQSIRRNLDLRGILLVQSCGPATAEHQARLNKMFGSIPRLQRPGAYWSSWDEVEQMLGDAGFRADVVTTFRLPLIELFQARYNLTADENTHLHDVLGEYDWLQYTVSASSHQKQDFSTKT
jgi:hypothetical protein